MNFKKPYKDDQKPAQNRTAEFLLTEKTWEIMRLFFFPHSIDQSFNSNPKSGLQGGGLQKTNGDRMQPAIKAG